MPLRFALAAFCLTSLAAQAQPAGASAEAPARPFLWRLADADSRVYLLGSVHALPAGTDVLPGRAAEAYADAEALAFEVDLDAAPQAAAAALLTDAFATDGLTLSKRLGRADAARLRRRLAEAGLDAAAAETMQPWLVGLMLGAQAGVASGFTAEAGVDAQLFARAAADGKPRLSLESAADQVAALSGLPMKDQVALLRAALDEGEVDLAEIVATWRSGDAEALARVLDADMDAALRRRVLTDRNARWVPLVEAFLDRTGADGAPQDVLVVVGAAHLVGADSVVEMLRARGRTVERLGDGTDAEDAERPEAP